MSACVIHDAQGQAVSISSSEPPVVPAGLTLVVITGPEFTGLTSGSHRWNPATRAVEVDSVKVTEAANLAAIRTFIANAAPTLQAIIDTPNLASGTLSSAVLSNAARTTQSQVKDMARGLKRVGRMLLDDYSGTD